jgi:hypothetical protein
LIKRSPRSAMRKSTQRAPDLPEKAALMRFNHGMKPSPRSIVLSHLPTSVASFLSLSPEDRHELERLAPWGNVDPADFSYLESKSVRLVPYEIPVTDAVLVPESVKTILVNRSQKTLASFSGLKPGEDVSGLPESAKRFVFPAVATPVLASRVNADFAHS